MRRPHIIRTNRRREAPSHLIFVDTEAHRERVGPDREEHTLRLGVACYVRRRRAKGRVHITESWFTFRTPSEFWSWVVDHTHDRTRLYVYAHNWAYDACLLDLARVLPGMGWVLTTYVNESPPFIAVFRRGRRAICLVDTLNYWRVPLADLGRRVGEYKATMPPDDADDSVWEAYCRQDVQVLKRTVLEYLDFLQSHDLGNYQLTLASQAFCAYRHRYMDYSLYVHTNEEVLALEREAYRGGRVEARYIGPIQGPVYLMDVNSEYPYVMREGLYPTRLMYTLEDCDVERLARLASRHLVIARVLVDTPEPAYAVRTRDHLVFPVGQFWGVLCTPEIAYALRAGHIRQVGLVAVYEGYPIFRRYVDDLYTLRLKYRSERNPAWEFMVKTLLNALYGKFGERGIKWRIVRDATPEDPPEWFEQELPTEPVQHYRVRMGKVLVHAREGETDNSMPAVAAHVTAYGRMYLWSLMQVAGIDHVYYVDTDSLLVDTVGYLRLRKYEDDTRLGMLKLQQAAETAEIRGAKDYTIGDKTKTKGLRKGAREVGLNQYLVDVWRGFDWLIGQGIYGRAVIEVQQKRLRRDYRKGVITPSGWVRPRRGVDGEVLPLKQCSRCGYYTDDYVEDVDVRLKPVQAGWTGTTFVPYDQPRARVVGQRRVVICAYCR